MYVTDFNNDVAPRRRARSGAGGWREDGIMAFKGARASELWAGRVRPHATTRAPDLLFSGFSEQVDGPLGTAPLEAQAGARCLGGAAVAAYQTSSGMAASRWWGRPRWPSAWQAAPDRWRPRP